MIINGRATWKKTNYYDRINSSERNFIDIKSDSLFWRIVWNDCAKEEEVVVGSNNFVCGSRDDLVLHYFDEVVVAKLAKTAPTISIF